MKYRIRVFAFFLVLAVLLSNSSIVALADTILNMPGALQIIDEEAFYGATSIDKVVLPNNVTEIRARAFANSSLSEINLPDSIKYIARDAFDGPEKVAVTANKGSYAYDWAVDNGYIMDSIPMTSITLNKSELNLTVGTTDTLSTTVLPTNATDKTILWTSSDRSVANVNEYGDIIATGAGTAIITASAADKSGVSQTCTVNSTAKNEVLSVESITRNSQTVNLGDTVTWTVELSGAVGLVEYTYILHKDGAEIDRISKTPFNTYQAVIEQSGVYSLEVIVTDGSQQQTSGNAESIVVNNGELQITHVECKNDSLFVGDTLEYEVFVEGGIEPYTYDYDLKSLQSSGEFRGWDFVEGSESSIYMCELDLQKYEGLIFCLEVTVTDALNQTTSFITSDTIEVNPSPVYMQYGNNKTSTHVVMDPLYDLEDTDHVTVYSDSYWIATPLEPWISVTPKQGGDGDDLTINVDRNDGIQRNGKVMLSCNGRNIYIDVCQCARLSDEPYLVTPAYSSEVTNPTIIDPNTTEICATWNNELQVSQYMISLSEWNVSNGRFVEIERKTLNNNKNSYLFSELTLNMGGLYRMQLTRIMTDSTDKRYNSYSVYFTPFTGECGVTVNGKNNITCSLEGTEDYKRYTIASSGTWTATVEDDWLMVYKSRITQKKLDQNEENSAEYSDWHGTPGSYLYICALPNSGSSARTGTVKLNCGTATATINVEQKKYYEAASITSPVLSTSRSSKTNVMPETMAVQWSAAIGGTGRYKLKLYKIENKDIYTSVLSENSLRQQYYSLSSNLLTEGCDYELELYSEISSGNYSSVSYYFHVAYSNELTVNASVSGTGKVGDSLGIRVDAHASGGSGGYKYCFYLKNGNEVISRSIGWNTQSYWTFPLPEVGDYYIQVYVMDSEGTVISYDSSTINAVENTDEYVLLDSETAATRSIDGNGGSVVVNVNCPRDWQFSKDVSWLTIDASGYKQSRLTASATANTGMSVRTGHVTITCGNTQAVLTINQGGAGSVALSASTLEFESVGGEQQITVASSGTWTAVPRDTWITVSSATGNSGSYLKITAEQNNANALRIGYVDVTSDGVTKTVTVHQQGTSNAAITSVRNIQQVETGVETNIMVYVANTDRVRMNIDGKYTSQEYFDNEGFHVCIVRYKFYSSGTHKLTFSYYSNGQWKDDSTVYSLNVVAPKGNLDSPVVSVDKALHDKGDEVNLSWTDTGNATAYTAYIYKDGELLSKKAEQTTKQIKLTAADTTLAGHYMIVIMSTAQGYNQGSGYAEFDVQWEGYLQRKYTTAFKYKNMTDEQPQLRFGNKYKITEEVYVGDILLGKVQSGDIVLGYANMSYFGTEYWHPCLKNGVYEHNLYTSYEAEHPHKKFTKCSVCEEWQYTGELAEHAGATVATCCLCGNHNYTSANGKSHPHYVIKTCSRCGKRYTDTSTTMTGYPGCCICNGHNWGNDGICIVCGTINTDVPEPEEPSTVLTPSNDDMYVIFVRSLIEDETVRAEFDSWRNAINSYKNTGHLLLEFTQDSLKDKNLSADSAIWKWKDALWGISSLGVKTILGWLKDATGNSDGVQQYTDILEKSYLIYTQLTVDKVNDFVAPYKTMQKTISTSNKWLQSMTGSYFSQKEKDFGGYTIDEILDLNEYANKHNENWPELKSLAGQIKVYKAAGTIDSAGNLIFDEVKLLSGIQTYSANKTIFLAALVNASQEVLDAIDMLQETSNDKDFITAVYKFRKGYKAAITGSIQSYAISSSFEKNWTDIADFSLSMYNYFADYFGGKIDTSVWKIIEKILKQDKGIDTKMYSNASLLLSTTVLATDTLLGTSETQKSVQSINKMIKLKATVNTRITADLIRFKYAQTTENARRVITDIKLLKSYQILGEQYALGYYENQIKIEADFERNIVGNMYELGMEAWYQDQLKRIESNYNTQLQKMQNIVDINNRAIESFSILD